MTPLRQKMIDELRIGNYSPHTEKAYLQAVEKFAYYFNRSPAQLGLEEVREYLVHLVEERRVAWSTYSINLCALRFLYHRVLEREQLLQGIACPKNEYKLPVVLSREEVKQFFAAAQSPKTRTMLWDHF